MRQELFSGLHRVSHGTVRERKFYGSGRGTMTEVKSLAQKYWSQWDLRGGQTHVVFLWVVSFTAGFSVMIWTQCSPLTGPRPDVGLAEEGNKIIVLRLCGITYLLSTGTQRKKYICPFTHLRESRCSFQRQLESPQHLLFSCFYTSKTHFGEEFGRKDLFRFSPSRE